jgi:hypothetical protein
MTHTERLFQHTLPRWSGVTVLTIDEQLEDMWIRGEQAGSHAGVDFNPDGIQQLQTELRRDFTGAPSKKAFTDGISTIADLDDEMQLFDQKSMPAEGAMLKVMLSKEELKKLNKRAKERAHE